MCPAQEDEYPRAVQINLWWSMLHTLFQMMYVGAMPSTL
jgi:hypothetical protein